jgi:hypothetical protein
MYELKKMERYLRVNLGPGPSSYKNRIYRAAVSQRLRNTDLKYVVVPDFAQAFIASPEWHRLFHTGCCMQGK